MVSFNINDVENRLVNVFKDSIGLDLSKDNMDIRNGNLFGEPFWYRARDLINLLFDIEKEFEIKISEEDIINKFDSFNSILQILQDNLEVKKGE